MAVITFGTQYINKPTPSKGGDKPMAKDPNDFSNCKFCTVEDGDTLFDIAQRYKVAIQQLRYFNHINKATWHISKGQKIYIPNVPVYVPRGK